MIGNVIVFAAMLPSLPRALGTYAVKFQAYGSKALRELMYVAFPQNYLDYLL